MAGFPSLHYTGGTIDTEAWSAFADVTYDFTERWALSVGGGYTEDKRSADIFRANYLGVGSPFFGNASAVRLATTSDYEASRTYSDVSPRINLSSRITQDVNLYIGYSQGFKAGSFDPRGANFATPEVVKGFEPETLGLVRGRRQGDLARRSRPHQRGRVLQRLPGHADPGLARRRLRMATASMTVSSAPSPMQARPKSRASSSRANSS